MQFIANSSVLLTLATSGAATFSSSVTAGGNFELNSATTGLKSNVYDTNFYAENASYWSITSSAASTAGALLFRQGYTGTVKGFAYWDSSGFGLLGNVGNWAVRVNYGSSVGGTLFGDWSSTGTFTATNFIGAGTGLTGTASGLSIGGSAGSAATAEYTTGTAGGAIRYYDLRTIAPNSMAAGRMGFGFTSFNNNNTAPWADYLHLRSYEDSSGGADNLVVFNKSTIGMRIYQQTWGSSTAYSSYKDIAFTDGTNSSGTWGISVTGNAGTATAAQNATFLTQPNATWAARVQLGGNGSGSGVANIAVVQATDGNLHIDNGLGKAMYLNYYHNGVIYLNGATYFISSNGSQYNGNAATATTATSATTAGTSTYASILSTTNQGIVGSTGLTTVSSEAQWSNFPIGYSAMFSSNQVATGAPSATYGFFIKIANRDAAGGL
jgi:hypothetical protein